VRNIRNHIFILQLSRNYTDVIVSTNGYIYIYKEYLRQRLVETVMSTFCDKNVVSSIPQEN
jgi:exosome complex RNA-binding protein Rrp4